jgi:hypothetical protein
MSDLPEGTGMQDADKIDPGEPIPALANFEQEASRNLIVQIRRSIQRRTTVGQLAAFSINIPQLMLKELWFVLFTRPDLRNMRKGGHHGEETS